MCYADLAANGGSSTLGCTLLQERLHVVTAKLQLSEPTAAMGNEQPDHDLSSCKNLLELPAGCIVQIVSCLLSLRDTASFQLACRDLQAHCEVGETITCAGAPFNGSLAAWSLVNISYVLLRGTREQNTLLR